MTRTKMDRTEEIIEILRKSKGLLSSNQVAIQLKCHVNTAQWGLESLSLKGLIKKIPTSNGTYWELKQGGQQ
jgi:DNA-binding transcriptional regulator YhcF (GntR family)